MRLLLALLACLLPACGGTTSTSSLEDVPLPDASIAEEVADASTSPPPDAGIDKSAQCASTFGSDLTNAFGRLDGTVVALVPPDNTRCTAPNSTHLVVQVLVDGAVYRMVVNVLSDGRGGTDTRMRYAEIPHALIGAPWQEGWHPGASLDYPMDLGAHNASFTPHEMAELVDLVSARLNIGDRISVYATSQNAPSSAHLVHRNADTAAPDDGAIVVGPDSGAALFLIFHWDGLVF